VAASSVLPSSVNVIRGFSSLKERAVAVIGKLINLASHI